jgi:hypothetical protein
MGKKMRQEMGANNGAPGGGEGEMFWVSVKTEPISFQPQSNNNTQKYQKSRAFQQNSHIVQMATLASFFADQ